MTHYEVLETFPGERPTGDVSLVRLVLETGRTHQIRVHLAHIGHPVLGDADLRQRLQDAACFVEPRSAQDGGATLERQALHAETLKFVHPTTEKNLALPARCPGPRTFLPSCTARRKTTEKQARNVCKRYGKQCLSRSRQGQVAVTGTPDEFRDFTTM